MHSADDLVVNLGDFNGHMGRHIGFDEVHGGHDVGDEFRMNNITSFAWRKSCVSNEWLKTEKKRKETFRLRENNT